MNLSEKLTEAQALLEEEEKKLEAIEEAHKMVVKDQKAVIYVAKKQVKAYEELIEKAEALEKK